MENTSRMTAALICGAVFLGLLVALQFLSGPPPAEAAPGGQPKVAICHYDADTDTYHQITVAEPAVPAHMAHGDEAFGGACSAGIGACEAQGAVVCTMNGAACDATPGTPAPDDSTCNGIDDDCDGSVDEDYVSQPTSCGTGVCAANGSTSCVNGAVVDSCIARTSSPETCDNLDNDCDGAVDEGLTLSCYNGPGGTNGVGACQAGSQTCTAGVWGACTGQVLPAPEVCNATDDDCDGAVDEELSCSE